MWVHLGQVRHNQPPRSATRRTPSVGGFVRVFAVRGRRRPWVSRAMGTTDAWRGLRSAAHGDHGMSVKYIRQDRVAVVMPPSGAVFVHHFSILKNTSHRGRHISAGGPGDRRNFFRGFLYGPGQP